MPAISKKKPQYTVSCPEPAMAHSENKNARADNVIVAGQWLWGCRYLFCNLIRT